MLPFTLPGRVTPKRGLQTRGWVGIEVRDWRGSCAPICASRCEYLYLGVPGFLGSRTPGLDPIKSMRVGVFAVMAAASFVALCLCSSLYMDFIGIWAMW